MPRLPPHLPEARLAEAGREGGRGGEAPLAGNDVAAIFRCPAGAGFQELPGQDEAAGALGVEIVLGGYGADVVHRAQGECGLLPRGRHPAVPCTQQAGQVGRLWEKAVVHAQRTCKPNSEASFHTRFTVHRPPASLGCTAASNRGRPSYVHQSLQRAPPRFLSQSTQAKVPSGLRSRAKMF